MSLRKKASTVVVVVILTFYVLPSQCQMDGGNVLRMLGYCIDYGREIYLSYRDEMDMVYCVVGGIGNMIKKRVPRPRQYSQASTSHRDRDNSETPIYRFARSIGSVDSVDVSGSNSKGQFTTKENVEIHNPTGINGGTVVLKVPQGNQHYMKNERLEGPQLSADGHFGSSLSTGMAEGVAFCGLFRAFYEPRVLDSPGVKSQSMEKSASGKDEEVASDLVRHPSILASLLGVTSEQFMADYEAAGGGGDVNSRPSRAPPVKSFDQASNSPAVRGRTKRHTMMEEMAFDMFKDNPLIVAILKTVGGIIYFGQLIKGMIESSILLSCAQEYIYYRGRRWIGLIP